jgi:uncharacterized repeat protein (TIGR03803 family)
MTCPKSAIDLRLDGRQRCGKRRIEIAAAVEKRESARRMRLREIVALASFVMAFGCSEHAWAAPKLTTLFTFANLRGAAPSEGLIADNAGNLYGTAALGGAHDHGVAFELSPPAAGKRAWKEKVLVSFGGRKGDNPNSAFVADSNGDFYGTASGVAFELSPPVGDQKRWTRKTINTFKRAEVEFTTGRLVIDGAGNLFGTASGGNNGLVYELSPPGQGQTRWSVKVLHTFGGADGSDPQAGLMADTGGNLYGTTTLGGVYGNGVVFELSPPVAGQSAWTESVLHSFDGTDGANPDADVMSDGAGNLFGTTVTGGANNDGVVFELSPPGAGHTVWTERVLYSFDGANGAEPLAGLITDGAGNLYGTTREGGANNDGVIFELKPKAGPKAWSEAVLASFDGANGSAPNGDLFVDNTGALYGTTSTGGANGDGVAFKLTP